MSELKTIMYCRKSTEQEERQMLSIEAQRTELLEFAAREHVEIVASFEEARTARGPGQNDRVEPPLSANTLFRATMQRMIAWKFEPN
jgi:hypothetical protein